MPHPHKSLLDEFQYAIDHFAISVPNEVKKEAQKLHDDLLADENADENKIQKVLFEIGLKTYSPRMAFHELSHNDTEEKVKAIVLDHVDRPVSEKLKLHLDSGVRLDEIIESDIFEEGFSAEERYQVEDGVLVAKQRIHDETLETFDKNSDEYVRLLKKWEDHAVAILEAIKKLEDLAVNNSQYKDEILQKSKRLKEGFLVTEPDPELDEIKNEIEYWQGLISEEEGS
ncbi:MAG: hypothetical protein ABIH21_02760 [Patescibacteria group bacterium]